MGVILTPELQTYLDSNPTEFTFFDVVTAEFDSETIRTAFAPFDIEFNGHTHTATGQFVSMSEIKETSEHTIESMTIEASGIPRFDGETSLIGLTLNEDFVNRPVRIDRLFMNPNSWMDILGHRNIVDGFIKKASIKDGDKTDSKSEFIIQFQIASFFSDFNRTNGRKTDDGSHQALFPGDRFFQTASKVAKEIQWKTP